MGIAIITDDGVALVDGVRRSFFQFVSLRYRNKFVNEWVRPVNYFVSLLVGIASLLVDIMKYCRRCVYIVWALVALQVIKGFFAFKRFSQSFSDFFDPFGTFAPDPNQDSSNYST